MATNLTSPSLSDVQDILYYIFPHLDTDRSPWDDIFRVRQTLLHSALTCRSFSRPALSALWRSLPSEKPLRSLIHTLGMAQEVELINPLLLQLYDLKAKPPPQPFVTEDPLTHPNWSRFRDYATLVRRIQLDPCIDTWKRPLTFWPEVAGFLGDEPILPRLQFVNITGDDSQTLRAVPLALISPSVREMKIWIKAHRERPDEPKQLLSDACARTPRLESISIAIHPWSVNLSTLHCNPALRSVSVHAQISIADLEPLTELAELRDLSVVLGEGGALTSTLSFPCLRRLTVRSGWDTVRDLLERLEAPHTDSLALHVAHADPTEFIHSARACLQTAASAFPLLESLLVDSSRTARNPLWDFPTTLDTEGTLMAAIEPLLSLRRLRHLTLDFRLFILRLASDDVRKMAEAWPDMEELAIEAGSADGGRASFESLVHFARGCPRLRALRLPAMDLAAGALEGLEYPKAPHALRDLDVAEVVFPRGVDLSGEMTAFIQRVFPKAAVPFAQHPIVVTDEESGDRSRLV